MQSAFVGFSNTFKSGQDIILSCEVFELLNHNIKIKLKFALILYDKTKNNTYKC